MKILNTKKRLYQLSGIVVILTTSLFSCVRAERNASTLNSSAGLGFLFLSYLQNTHTVSGTVKGVTGSSITLQNNGSNVTTIYGDDAGSIRSFRINAAYDYDITVSDSGGRTCTVTNGSGTLSGDVSNVEINCILSFSIGQSAVGEITGFSQANLNSAVVGGKLIIPDKSSNTLRFFDASLTSGTVAGDQVYSIAGASKPVSVFALHNGTEGFGYVDENISTYGNIYIWDSMITTSGNYTGARTLLSAPAATCDGTHFSSPEGAFRDGTHLIVADTINNRVLIWNSIPSGQDTPPDLVLGQTNLNTCTSSSAASTSLSSPYSVWSDGERILVVDEFYHRVLIWNSWPTVNGQAADLVLGQPDFTTGAAGSAAANDLNSPYAVYVNGDQIFVVDGFNYRVLIWNSWPTSINQPADVVLGQADFGTTSTGTGLDQMQGPYGMTVYENRLYVNDWDRVLVFEAN